ncbi:MAG: DUF2723 domain-containing protein [Bacteroidota bacterium]
MQYKKINNISGWIICAIACTVYILSSEAGGSFWDCGEFVSCCYKVQIPHPPGAPLFVLLGRLFIVAFGDNPLTAAKAVNIMSALASGFTILFLYWSITHFARRIMWANAVDKTLSALQIAGMVGAGAVGALAYTFSDSFWFSAVEGEVYAMSSFFSAIVFWCILKWDEQADQPGADKWLVFIFFLIGLSIGVHLLCLLNIPAIVMIYYFRKRNTINYTSVRKYFIRLTIIGGVLAMIAALIGAQAEAAAVEGLSIDGTPAALMFFGAAIAIALLFAIEKIGKTKKSLYGGIYIFFIMGCVLEQFIQTGVIQYSVKAAGMFDVFFVNSLRLPFFSGFTVFFILMGTGIWFGLRFANRKRWPLLRISLWSLVFLMLGYSSYITTMIRSNADTAVDMFNVDNPISLEGYLGREQYGDFPILYGQKFNARPIGYRETSSKYQKGNNGYTNIGKDFHYVFAPEDKMVFPRMWDMNNDQSHADYYADYLGVGKTKDGGYDIEKDESGHALRPNFSDNLSFFINYQNYFMYFRYFMWNFSGKQNDLQGLLVRNPRDGNWITGIPFIDNSLYGNQDAMPEGLKKNKAHNTLFALPLILGLIGLFYQFKKNKGDAIAATLLFYCSGLAIIVYINQSGMQPRERDYAYAGSFYAFAIWIGLAVLYFIDLASKWDKALVKNMLIKGGISSAALTVLCMSAGLGGSESLIAGIGIFLVYAFVSSALPYAMKFLSNRKVIVVTAITLSLFVPLLMAQQEWDDHDRSKKQLARDVAKDYLESCAPNAILFTMADNDTYPLWYAQEVEGIRPDVRVVITTLISADWCINQLRYKINQSDPVDLVWSKEQVEGNKRNIAVYQPLQQFPQNNYYELYDLLKNYMGDDKNVDERGYNILPVNKISVPVDEKLVKQNGTVNATDSVVAAMQFQIPKSSLYKNDLAILNVIAANQWKRPIYFTMPYNDLGFGDYLRRDGLAYRLVPVKQSTVNTDRMFDVVMNKFGFGNAQLPNVYYDEENRRQLNILRRTVSELAIDLAAKNRKEDAIKVLTKADSMMAQQNFPYAMVSRANEHNRSSLYFLEACYRAGYKPLIDKVSKLMKDGVEQEIKYYNSLTGNPAINMQYEQQGAQTMLNDINSMAKMNW